MKIRAQALAAKESSHYAVSAFTRELLDNIAVEHYSFSAWRTLVSRSWARSLEDIRVSPARTRSFSYWVGIAAATGIAIILWSRQVQSQEQAFTALLLWLPWFAFAVFFLITHLGMVDDRQGKPHRKLFFPNGLSFLRLALAPLVLWPCLRLPTQPTDGLVFALFLAVLSLTDILDGWLARKQQLQTRLGRMLDGLADLALLTFLSVGLYLAGSIPGSLLVLLLARYPGLLIAVLFLYFARGPVPLRPTLIGKATTFVTSIILLAIAFELLLPGSWPTAMSIEWSVEVLPVLIAVNILYLIYRGIAWITVYSPSNNH